MLRPYMIVANGDVATRRNGRVEQGPPLQRQENRRKRVREFD